MKRLLMVALAAGALAGGCAGPNPAQPSSTGTVVPVARGESVRAVDRPTTPTPLPSVILRIGGVTGEDDDYTPADGNTAHGGAGESVDGIPCAKTMITNRYHVHFFFGVLLNGKEIATADGAGLYLPGPESNGYTPTATNCYYAIHTHDASGMVHVEADSNAPLSSSLFPLGKFLDVWGEPISGSAFGPFQGPVHVFYALTPLRNIYSGPYKEFAGNPWTLPLYSHEAIWVEVGTVVPATQLPSIRFYTEY